MNALTTEFLSMPFKVLGFPCNNFNLQEPSGNYTELLNGLKYVRPGGGYVPNFQMFKKIDVNGKNELPLYTYLKSMCGPTSEVFEDTSMLYYEPLTVSDVRWNFEVFLISKTGRPLYRYSSETPVSDIETDIKVLLNQSNQERPIVESNEVPVETGYVAEPSNNKEQVEEETNDIAEYKLPQDITI